MSRWTYEKDADLVEIADDLENLVSNKRINWIASATEVKEGKDRTNIDRLMKF